MKLEGTTICAVKRNGEIAIAGDGQVTMGEKVVMKATARKVRRLYHDTVVIGFAGSVADAFTLSEMLEDKLTQYSGNLPRAAVELAMTWRGDRAMRQLEAMLLLSLIHISRRPTATCAICPSRRWAWTWTTTSSRAT